MFTVTVSDDPFTDGLYLTNQVRGEEDGTLLIPVNSDAIVQIVLDQPELNITKGVVEVLDGGDTYGTFAANDNVDTSFSEPGSGGYRFTANGGQMTQHLAGGQRYRHQPFRRRCRRHGHLCHRYREYRPLRRL